MLLKVCSVIALLALVNGSVIKYPGQNFRQKILRSETRDVALTRDDDCEPDSVPLLIVTWFVNVILLEWTAPTYCVTGFLVNLNDNVTEVPFDNSTDIYAQLYDGLEACTVYEVGVRVVGENGIVGGKLAVTLTTLAPFVPNQISNISFEVYNDSWVIFWEPPELQGNCITEYDLYIWELDYSNTINAVVTSPSYVVTPFIPCTSYGARVIPFIGLLGGAQVSELIILPPKETQPPTIVEVIIGYITNLIIDLESVETNPCEIRYLSIECTMNGTYTYSFIQLYVDSSSRPQAEIGIVDLPGNTIYSCQAAVTNVGGTSEFSEPIEFVID